MSVINIYACGGTGSNIALSFNAFHNEEHEGFASIKTYFVDTSRSNLPKTVPDERVFIYKNIDGTTLDGNGKLRTSNYNVISETSTIKSILNDFTPGDLNIVIGSAGGGTGSVVGPLLAKELITQGYNVIILLIGSTTSRMDIKNTLNTIKSYESLSTSTKTPFCVLYRENDATHSRKSVNDYMEQYLFLLSAFFSGQNHGLDTADLRNFLAYHNVTQYPPRLTAIDFFSQDIKLPTDVSPISAVTLTTDNIEVTHDFMVDYQVTGTVPNTVGDKVKEMLPIHLVLFSGGFTSTVTRLQNLLKEHDKRSTLSSQRPIVDSTDPTTKDDLIL